MYKKNGMEFSDFLSVSKITQSHDISRDEEVRGLYILNILFLFFPFVNILFFSIIYHYLAC